MSSKGNPYATKLNRGFDLVLLVIIVVTFVIFFRTSAHGQAVDTFSATAAATPKPKATPKPTPTPKPTATPKPKDGETDWNGTTSSDFNTGSNWTAVSGLAPPGTSDVAWLKSTPTNKTINLSSNSGAAGSIVGFYFNGTSSSGYDITSSSTSIKFTLTAIGTSIGTELGNTTAVAIGAENTSGTNTIDAPIVLGAAGGATQTIIQASGGTLVINGIVSEQNAGIKLSLSGAGTVTLSGVNTYSGGTTVSAGTLNIGNNSALGTGQLTLSGGTIAASGGARTIGNNTIISTSNGTIAGSNDLTFTGTFTNSTGSRTLTVNNAGTTTFGTVNLSESNTGRTLTITGSGNTTFGGTVQNGGTGAGSLAFDSAYTGTATLNGANTFTGGTTLSSGTFVLGNKSAFGSGGTVGMNGVSISANTDLSGSNAITNAISDGGTDNTFTGNNNIEFSGTWTDTANRTITNNISAGALTLSGTVNIRPSGSSTSTTLTLDGSGNTTISGVIQDGGTSTGVGRLTYAGTGTLTLTGSNTYSGATTINSGATLQIDNGGTSGNISGLGAITDNGTLIFDRSNTIQQGSGFSDTITGTGSVIQNGSGILIVGDNTVNNSWSGGTTINAGTIQMAFTGSNLGSTSGSLTINNSGILDLHGVSLTIGNLNGGPSSAIYNNFSSSTTTLTIGNGNTGGGNFQGVIENHTSGTGVMAITKAGSGVIEFSGTNTYTGDTTISGGMLALGNSGGTNLGLPGGIGNTGGTSHLTLDGGVLGASGTFSRSLGASSGSTVDFAPSNGSSGGFAGFGTAAGFNPSNNLTVLLNNSNASPISWGLNSQTNNFLGFGDTLLLGNAAANGTVDFQNSLVLVNQGVTRTVQVDRSSVAAAGDIDAKLSGVISGSDPLAKTGAGTLQLTGANTYTGKTSIQNGILSVSSLNSVSGGSASSNLGAPTTVANGTIAIGATTTTGQLTYTGTGETTDRVVNLAGTTGGATLDQSGTGNLKFSSNFTATGAGIKTLTLQGSSSGTGEIAGAIVDDTGTNKTSVTKSGTGTWTLSGANTYTGATTISGGTLQLGNGSTTGSLSMSSAITDNANFTINRSDSISQGTQFSGSAITGTGSFTQAGGGTTTLNAANSYSGTTTVSGGTLNANGSGVRSLGGSNNIVVNSGGTLLTTTAQQFNGTTPPTMTLAGGTFKTNGTSQNLGALTLSSTSIIDFGAGSSDQLKFANSSANSWSGTLNIYDWTGNPTNVTLGGGTDQLFVGTDSSGLTGAQLAEVQFFSGNGTGSYGIGAMILMNGEIVPIPETGTWVAGVLTAFVLASAACARRRTRHASK